MDRRRHPPVPTTVSVVPGAAVNIVLKADQPTGRTVSGVVRDLLTRGNHPRGIKVRLADGRVGRVQSMASSASVSASTAAAPTSGPSQANQDAYGSSSGPTEQLGLDAYVKQAKPQQRAKARLPATSKDDSPEDAAPAEAVTCPVCGAFEGDEAAVSHHVATHFES